MTKRLVTKKHLFVGITLLGLVALLIIVLSVNRSCVKEVGSVVGIRNDCKQLSDCNFIIGDRDDCYFGVATFQKNASICDMVQTLWKKNGCVINIAIELKDQTVCEKIDKREDYWWEDRERCKEKAGVDQDFSWDLKKGIEKCGPYPVEIYEHPGAGNFEELGDIYWLPDCSYLVYSLFISGTGFVEDWEGRVLAPEHLDDQGGIWKYYPNSGRRQQVYFENGAGIGKWVSPSRIEIIKSGKDIIVFNLDTGQKEK